MLRFDDAERQLDLGVHDLIEAGPPAGDLSLRLAWSARARMREGQRVHGRWQADRAAQDEAFRAEVVIRHRCVVRGWEVTISGRLDGLSREGEHQVIEEVKSTLLPASRLVDKDADSFPSWRHQLQLYLFFLSQATADPVLGRLVLISVADGSSRVLHVPPDPGIEGYLQAQLDWIVRTHEARRAWMARRRAATVPFAHPTWRPGQEGLADEATEALARGRHLLLRASTGYGKTAAALHAALREAFRTDKHVFFATARTTQQRMAEQTARAMAERGLELRAVSIRARDKVCLNDVVACRPDACPYAAGYHDKVRQGEVIERLQGVGLADPDAVMAEAWRAQVCPFALSLDLAAQADLIIGDYNYAFDPGLRLEPLSEHAGDWIVIADEAHNLPERAMGYGSPEVDLGLAEAAVDQLLDAGPAFRACRRAMESVAEWLRGGIDRVTEDEVAYPLFDEEGEPVGEGLRRGLVRELAEELEGLALTYALLRLEHPLGADDPWLDTTRAVLRLRAALDRAGPETVVLWRRGADAVPGQLSLLGRGRASGGIKLFCRDPSGLVGPLFGSLAGSICMSATLDPPAFYVDLLGLDPERVTVTEHPSPFPPEHRRVVLLPEVSTEYRRRRRDRAPTAALISESLAAMPGNVAVYFPSFAYLESVRSLVDTGARPVLVQQRGMDEEARALLVETMGRGEGHALFAVLGGIFAEGIDLPGEGLVGAVVVGPALPPATLERRLLQRWHQTRHGQGFRYAWLVPGMSRVVQAAGRVLRTPEDRGAIVLIGRRFLQRDYQAFFPADWEPSRAVSPGPALSELWPS